MKIILCAVLVGLLGVIESKSVHSLNEAPRLRRASAASSDHEATVLRSESVVNSDGFNYAFETNNGIAAQATGGLKGESISVQGEYKFTSPEGVPVHVSYTADEEGYKPVGDLLPVPPPTPEAILRSLQYIAAHPAPVETYKKQ